MECTFAGVCTVECAFVAFAGVVHSLPLQECSECLRWSVHYGVCLRGEWFKLFIRLCWSGLTTDTNPNPWDWSTCLYISSISQYACFCDKNKHYRFGRIEPKWPLGISVFLEQESGHYLLLASWLSNNWPRRHVAPLKLLVLGSVRTYRTKGEGLIIFFIFLILV